MLSLTIKEERVIVKPWKGANGMKRDLPYATIILMIGNVIVFIISAITGDLLYNKGAFDSVLFSYRIELYRLVTSMFLHADLTHLTGNMILLYLSGELVERYCGKIRYLLIYFLSGITANSFSGIVDILLERKTLSVGASGAIFGLVGALLFLVIFAKEEYKEITSGRLIFMIVYMLYTGFTTESINNEAHIGGLLAGFLIMMMLYGRLLCPRKRNTDIVIDCNEME